MINAHQATCARRHRGMPGYAVYAGERCPASQERYIMPHARAEMYKRREDVQLWRGRWGCALGGKASPPTTPAERKSPAPPCQSAFSQHPRALRLWGSRVAEVRGSQRVCALTTFVGRGREGRGGSTGRRGHCPVPPPKGYYPVPPPKASYRVPPPKGRATAAYLRGARRRSPRGGARSGRRTRAAAQSPHRPPSYGPRRSR